MTRLRGFSAAVVACTVLFGCSKKNEYPEEVKQTFLGSCNATSKGNTQFCSCMLGKIQEKYTYEEFAGIEAQMRLGTPNAEFNNFAGVAAAQCRK